MISVATIQGAFGWIIPAILSLVWIYMAVRFGSAAWFTSWLKAKRDAKQIEQEEKGNGK